MNSCQRNLRAAKDLDYMATHGGPVESESRLDSMVFHDFLKKLAYRGSPIAYRGFPIAYWGFTIAIGRSRLWIGRSRCLMHACLLVHGSWLKAHGSWPREARGGSWLMAHGQGGTARPWGPRERQVRPGTGPALPRASGSGQPPLAMSHEP